MEKNFNGYAERAILTYEPFNVCIGDVISPGTHWTIRDSIETIGNACENISGNFITVFKCDKVIGHKVDYSKINEYEDDFDAEYSEKIGSFGISAECEDEQEIIVENTNFEVVEVSTSDYYGSLDEEGVPGIREIKLRRI